MKNVFELPNGKVWKLGFDLSVVLEMEEMLGKPFSEVNYKDTKENLMFMYAVVKCFNDRVEPFKKWIHNLETREIKEALDAAIAPHVDKFLCVPDVAEMHVAKTEDKGDEKNV